MDELLQDFLVETSESLDSVDAQLVRFEREPQNQEILRSVFRLVHSIKGTCGFLALTRLEGLTHAAETLMGQFRDGARVLPEAVGVILSVIDRIKTILAALEANQAEPPGDDLDLIDALMRLSGRAERPDRSAGSLQAPAPEDEPASGAPAEPPEEVPDTRPMTDRPNQANSIRVNIETLERLLNLVSELVLTRNQLLDLARNRDDHGLGAPLQRLSMVTAELQNSVMQTRMQPIGSAWQKLPRMVRDLCVELRKDVQLVMRGSETELDRQVLDIVRDPLTHLIRNAIDHGIEHPEERIMAGKPARATLTLTALHAAGAITISVADDGRGLDFDRIRQKAARLGLVPGAELDKLSEAQLGKLIFHPGFSTAEQITSVSGRGVGLDVVQSNIELIGGNIDFRSVRHGGCVFTLRLPLTLAIVPALLIEAAGQRFAMPQAAVVELLRLSPAGEERSETIEDTRMLRLRGQLLPLVDLAGTLGLEGEAAAKVDPLVVVLSSGSRRYAVLVDQILRTEEIVVKPMASQLRGIAVYGGNTILGDGSVVLILDPNGLARVVGITDEAERRWRLDDPVADDPAHPKSIRLLLFRAGASTAAVPASAILRLEDVPRERIEQVGSRLVMQYRGRLTPLHDLGSCADAIRPCVVVSWEDACVGLLVDEILDVVEEEIDICVDLARAGFVGSAIVGGRTIDIVDAVHFLAGSLPGLGDRRPAPERRQVLLVEPSAFFRDIVAPQLRGAGFDIAIAEDVAEAMRWIASGSVTFSLVTAGELPDAHAPAFVEKARVAASQRMSRVVLVSADSAQVGDLPGIDAIVSKFDRVGLIEALRAEPSALARAA